jgi:YjjG family noncanonical pyrimidine nucleotidase
MYKFILLDADNTLYDFDKAEAESLKATLEHLGVPCSETIISTYSAINLNLWKLYEKNLIAKETIKTQRFTELFHHLSVQADAYIASEVYRSHLETKSLLLPYALEVCEQLARHFVLAILTNGVATTQRSRFTLSPINKYITHLVISEELGTAKPNKAFFDAALDIIGCDASDALMVGDSLSSDIQGAINAGIDCCWFNPKRLPGEGYDIELPAIKRVFGSCGERVNGA